MGECPTCEGRHTVFVSLWILKLYLPFVVDECTATNDGVVVEVNNSCGECVCKVSGGFHCAKKLPNINCIPNYEISLYQHCQECP